MKYQIPYNFVYGEKIIKFIYLNANLIDSIYFGFSNSCRTNKHNKKSINEHLNVLKKIKNDLNIKLAYVINSVIDVKINAIDIEILDSGIVDIVIIARDDLFQNIYNIYGKQFKYELSRFYFSIAENEGQLVKKCGYAAFGFKKEIKANWDTIRALNNQCLLLYIANENCYENCHFKIEHNKNQILRNKNPENAKFVCPYKKERKFYTYEDILSVIKDYHIDILKICDRAFDDKLLLKELEKWVNVEWLKMVK